MKAETAGNAAIGIGGTLLAVVSPQAAAVFAGVSTGLWMLCQCAGWAIDRYRAFKQSRSNEANR